MGGAQIKLNTTMIALYKKRRQPDDKRVKRSKPLGQLYV
jgi:hypothetical protein